VPPTMGGTVRALWLLLLLLCLACAALSPHSSTAAVIKATEGTEATLALLRRGCLLLLLQLLLTRLVLPGLALPLRREGAKGRRYFHRRLRRRPERRRVRCDTMHPVTSATTKRAAILRALLHKMRCTSAKWVRLCLHPTHRHGLPHARLLLLLLLMLLLRRLLLRLRQWPHVLLLLRLRLRRRNARRGGKWWRGRLLLRRRWGALGRSAALPTATATLRRRSSLLH